MLTKERYEKFYDSVHSRDETGGAETATCGAAKPQIR